MSVQKINVPGPLTEATHPPMYVMIDMATFTLEPIGGDSASRLKITSLPYCWHIAEREGSEWAIVVTYSHGQDGSTVWEISTIQCDGDLTACGMGGGPTRECAKQLTTQINTTLEQFLR